jgi:hypothetical protein
MKRQTKRGVFCNPEIHSKKSLSQFLDPIRAASFSAHLTTLLIESGMNEVEKDKKFCKETSIVFRCDAA